MSRKGRAGCAYSCGRSEFATQWRPAVTRALARKTVAAAHPPARIDGAEGVAPVREATAVFAGMKEKMAGFRLTDRVSNRL